MIKVYIHPCPPRKSYIFRQNCILSVAYTETGKKQIQYGKDSNLYIEIQINDDDLSQLLNVRQDLETATADRVKRYHVFGHSNRCKWSMDYLVNHRLPVMCKNLLTEKAIVNKLIQNDPEGPFARKQVEIICRKGLVDYHDLDTACVCLIGPQEVLITIAEAYQRASEDNNDAAHGLIAFPLSWVMLSEEELSKKLIGTIS